MTPSVREELAVAVRRVNAEYARLPAPTQESIEIAYDGLEAEVDAAVAAGDRERAEAAIRAWKQHWLAEFEVAR